MADGHQIGADDVARKQFNTAFRGFDQYEVRAYLAQVAAEMAALHERERALRDRVASLETAAPPPGDVDEIAMEAALGAETTRVLHAAREAAAEIRAKAEEHVARLLREANDHAAHLRAEAEGVLALRTEEAEAAASQIYSAAQDAAGALRADAEAAATTTIEEAQQRGREMVAEAHTVRERVLKDLSRRRKLAATQLEQLLAARQRLLQAYDVVRQTLEQATTELSVAEAEAKLAADVAGLREPTEDDLDPVLADPAPDAVGENASRPEPEPEPDLAAAPAPVSTPEKVTESLPESEPVRPVTLVPPMTEAPAESSVPAEERRSSALRLLRRKAEPEASPAPLRDDDIESVRIIRPEPPPTAEAPPPPPPPPPPAPPSVVEEAAPAPEPEPLASAHVDEGAPVDDLFARLRADREAALAQAEVVLAEEAPDGGSDIEPEAAPEPEPEPDPADALFEARDAALEPIERALARAVKRALADEQNEVLDGLRRSRGKAAVASLLPERDEHAARYREVVGEHLEAAAMAGGQARDEVGALADAASDDLVTDVRSRVERAADLAGNDEEALIEALSSAYREWKSSRAEPFARHHAAGAYAAGVYGAASGGPMRWVVDPAEGSCPDCDDNALAGATAKGAAYPTGQERPPAHVGCRCLLVPAQN